MWGNLLEKKEINSSACELASTYSLQQKADLLLQQADHRLYRLMTVTFKFSFFSTVFTASAEHDSKTINTITYLQSSNNQCLWSLNSSTVLFFFQKSLLQTCLSKTQPKKKWQDQLDLLPPAFHIQVWLLQKYTQVAINSQKIPLLPEQPFP